MLPADGAAVGEGGGWIRKSTRGPERWTRKSPAWTRKRHRVSQSKLLEDAAKPHYLADEHIQFTDRIRLYVIFQGTVLLAFAHIAGGTGGAEDDLGDESIPVCLAHPA